MPARFAYSSLCRCGSIPAASGRKVAVARSCPARARCPRRRERCGCETVELDRVGPHRPWRTYGQRATLRCPALARRCARALRRRARLQRTRDRRRSGGRVARRRARRRRRRAGTRRRRLHRRHPRAARERKLGTGRPFAPASGASGRYATVLDTDLEYRAEAIRGLLAPVAAGEADAAFGIRASGHARPTASGTSSATGSWRSLRVSTAGPRTS